MYQANHITLHCVYCVYKQMNTPDDWKTGTIIKLPKKGDSRNCNNWLGITLLSLTCKIFSHIILKRISTTTDTILHQEQAGFRRGKSYILTLWQILEQSMEWNSMTYTAFIDFEKAFTENLCGEYYITTGSHRRW